MALLGWWAAFGHEVALDIDTGSSRSVVPVDPRQHPPGPPRVRAQRRAAAAPARPRAPSATSAWARRCTCPCRTARSRAPLCVYWVAERDGRATGRRPHRPRPGHVVLLSSAASSARSAAFSAWSALPRPAASSSASSSTSSSSRRRRRALDQLVAVEVARHERLDDRRGGQREDRADRAEQARARRGPRRTRPRGGCHGVRGDARRQQVVLDLLVHEDAAQHPDARRSGRPAAR